MPEDVADTRGGQLVIRRPPEGELLPKAHDMFREFRIIDALHPVGIPVARPVIIKRRNPNRATVDARKQINGLRR